VQYGNSSEIADLIVRIPNFVKIYVAVNDDIIWENPRVTVYRCDGNLGYFPAFQLVVNHFVIQGTVILSNSDIDFSSIFFNVLAEYRWHKGVAVLGPKIVTDSGILQNPNLLLRPSWLRMKLYVLIFSTAIGKIYLLLSDLKHRIPNYGKRKVLKSDFVYSIHGSCMIFKSGVDVIKLELFGGFLQNEEYFVAENFKNSIYFEKSLEISHFPHTAMKLQGLNRRVKFFRISYAYIYEKFFK
jgi:hypothetical protein